MKIHRRHLTQHRFQRYILWTLALLSWMAAVLGGNHFVSTRHQRQRFDISLPWLTQLVSQLLIIRAGRLARMRRDKPTYWRRGRDLRRPHLLRSVLGARLRRALRNKDIRVWIARLIAVLRNLDAYAAPLAKRMRRGLTRLCRLLPPIAPATLLLGAPALSPVPSDSS